MYVFYVLYVHVHTYQEFGKVRGHICSSGDRNSAKMAIYIAE